MTRYTDLHCLLCLPGLAWPGRSQCCPAVEGRHDQPVVRLRVGGNRQLLLSPIPLSLWKQ